MGKHKRFKSGQVVWATVADRNGVKKSEPRPLLLIKPDPISDESPLCCLAISTSRETDENDPAIEMPWNAKTGDTTGLYKWCRVVLLWHVLIDPKEVVKVSGVIADSFLQRVISEREMAMYQWPR